MSVKTSKRTSRRRAQAELRPEYRFDYRRSRPNRFAPEMKGAVAVVLDPDVATVFNTSDSVNAMLRSVISALPPSGAPARSTARRRAF
jgi:hypothetical protein